MIQHYPVKNTYDYWAIATVDSTHSGDDPHEFSAMFLYIKKPLLPPRHFQGFFSFSLSSPITSSLLPASSSSSSSSSAVVSSTSSVLYESTGALSSQIVQSYLFFLILFVPRLLVPSYFLLALFTQQQVWPGVWLVPCDTLT